MVGTPDVHVAGASALQAATLDRERTSSPSVAFVSRRLPDARHSRADHIVSLLAKILFESAPSLHTERPDAPGALEAIVARMLTKDPQEALRGCRRGPRSNPHDADHGIRKIATAFTAIGAARNDGSAARYGHLGESFRISASAVQR
jgi:hypothetical protein